MCPVFLSFHDRWCSFRPSYPVQQCFRNQSAIVSPKARAQTLCRRLRQRFSQYAA